MIFFRVDGNENIGTGHLMRCISIASELEKKGEPYKFIVSDDDSAEFLSRFDISCICLHSDWKDLDSEVEQIKDVLAEYGNTVLLIDSYYVTKEYFKEIKKLAKIFYIDDLCKELDMEIQDDSITYSKKPQNKKLEDIPAGFKFYNKLRKYKEYFSIFEYYSYLEGDYNGRIDRSNVKF